MTTEAKPAVPKCFVIMPQAPSVQGYEEGHFRLVYKELIEPACRAAGFEAYAATGNAVSEMIVVDVLKQLLDAEMVLCDMSSRNPNVFFELGLRQAFDKPVALIKDTITPRPFDTNGLRDYEYRHTMRVDEVRAGIEGIAEVIRETHKKHAKDAVTLMRLMNLAGAKPVPVTQPTADTQFLLNQLAKLTNQVASLEDRLGSSVSWFPNGSGMTPLVPFVSSTGGATGQLGQPTITLHTRRGLLDPAQPVPPPKTK